MCGIFGVFADQKLNKNQIKKIALHSEQRGVDSSGLCFIKDEVFKIIKADFRLKNLLNQEVITSTPLIAGHSRLVTDGMDDNQPVVTENVVVLHNGIIVNHLDLWKTINEERLLEIDTEIINALTENFLKHENDLEKLSNSLLLKCKGVLSAAIFLPKKGKLILLSNNGSLYIGKKMK